MRLQEDVHRRLNPLTGEWVLVSPHRMKRPWQGKTEARPNTQLPEHDPRCYLCPGNERAGGKQNPRYKNTFVFDNDYSALLPDTETGSYESSLLIAKNERGICRVVCFSPRHDLSLALLPLSTIEGVIDVWETQYRQLGDLPFISWVQIFENKGQLMGCSNPHPHGQIWANETVPDIPARETKQQAAYLTEKGGCLLCTYLTEELKLGERIVLQNSSFVVLVPFWATWPFEVLVLPRQHLSTIGEVAVTEDLADILKRTCIRYDNLFETSFPYSMGIHQKPTCKLEKSQRDGWHFHFHFYPPLLRSATVKKFMVGYEMLAAAQRDLTAEASAIRLRNLPDTHYLTLR